MLGAKSTLVLVLAVAVLFVGCNRKQQTDVHKDHAAFVATNAVSDDGRSSLLLEFTNGIRIEIQESQLTLQFQADNSFTAWFDPQSKRLLKTLLESPAKDGEPSQWVRDLNADGVADLRKIKGGAAEVFYEGRWFPCRPGGGTNTIIDVDGTETTLFYAGGKWSKTGAAK